MNPREKALDEAKTGGDPTRAIALALVYVGDVLDHRVTEDAPKAPRVRTGILEDVVSWTAGEPIPAGVRTHLPQTSTRCHCGSGMFSSDHCPRCGCEEYERYCNFVWSG